MVTQKWVLISPTLSLKLRPKYKWTAGLCEQVADSFGDKDCFHQRLTQHFATLQGLHPEASAVLAEYDPPLVPLVDSASALCCWRFISARKKKEKKEKPELINDTVVEPLMQITLIRGDTEQACKYSYICK